MNFRSSIFAKAQHIDVIFCFQILTKVLNHLILDLIHFLKMVHSTTFVRNTAFKWLQCLRDEKKVPFLFIMKDQNGVVVHGSNGLKIKVIIIIRQFYK